MRNVHNITSAVALLAQKLHTSIVEQNALDRSGATPHSLASFASGYPGIALALHHAGHYLQRVDYIVGSRDLMRRTSAITHSNPYTNPGICSGTAGFSGVVQILSAWDTRYRPASNKVMWSLVEQMHEPKALLNSTGIGPQRYDVIDGLAGQLSVLRWAARKSDDDDLRVACDAAANDMISALTEVLSVDESGHMKWMLTPESYPPGAGWATEDHPFGSYNLGFAHGLPGIVAALATEERQNSATLEATRRAVQLLKGLSIETQGAMQWPNSVPAAPVTLAPLQPHSESAARSAWCYGSPGVTLAMTAAARSLAEDDLRMTSILALEADIIRPPRETMLISPTFCHGLAGVVAILGLPAYRESSKLSTYRESVVDEVVGGVRESHLYGVVDRPTMQSQVDDPSLLTGASGVLLTLLGEVDVAFSDWKHMLLLESEAATA